MNTNELKNLLDKYYNGETSKEEEALIGGIIKQTDGDISLQPDKELFSFIEKEKGITANTEISIPDLAISAAPQKRIRIRRLTMQLVAAAAAILLLFGVIQQFESSTSGTLENTYDDPALAFNETKRALYTVSYKLNTSLEKLDELQKIDKAFEKLDGLNKLEKYSNMFDKL